MSELHEKLVLRKIASETTGGSRGVNSQPPPPPTTSPPHLTFPQAVMPPKKPPREPQPAPNPVETESSSPEGESEFLEALKLKRGSLKRSNTIQPFSPAHPEVEMPSRPHNPPRPISGQTDPLLRLPSPEPLRDVVPSYQVSNLATHEYARNVITVLSVATLRYPRPAEEKYN